MNIVIKKNTYYHPYKNITKFLLTPEIEDYLLKIKRKVKRHNLENCRNLNTIANKVFNTEIINVDIKTENCAGYFSRITKNIYIKNGQKGLIRRRIFCHEISHFIQSELKIFNPKKERLLSFMLYIEQQADTISHYLYPILFPNCRSCNKKDFQNYFSESGYVFLKKWYGRTVVNDLYVVRKKLLK